MIKYKLMKNKTRSGIYKAGGIILIFAALMESILSGIKVEYIAMMAIGLALLLKGTKDNKRLNRVQELSPPTN